jgi:hemolysin activation/secretion protein
VFQPGQQVGTSDLAVKVQDEQRFEATVRGDNHGLRETGQNRYRLEGVVNNVTGGADRFTGTLQATQVPANSFYWGAEYSRPLPYRQLWATVRYDRNRFDVGGEFRDRDIESDTQHLYLSLEDTFIRSRQRNLSARVELAKKQALTNIRARPQSKDALTVLNLGLDFDMVDSRFAGLNAGVFEYSHGFNDFLGAMGETTARVRPSRQGGDRSFAEGAFDKVFLSLSRLQSLTPLTEKLRHHSLLFRAEMQWSNDLLVPLEQYSVGGPTSVRGYIPTEALFDQAVFGSIEWIINAPGIADQPAFGNRTWGEVVQVSFFFDYAAGRLNNPIASEDPSDNLSGAGFSVSANNPNKFSAKLSIATPVGLPVSTGDHEPQYWVDLNLFF